MNYLDNYLFELQINKISFDALFYSIKQAIEAWERISESKRKEYFGEDTPTYLLQMRSLAAEVSKKEHVVEENKLFFKLFESKEWNLIMPAHYPIQTMDSLVQGRINNTYRKKMWLHFMESNSKVSEKDIHTLNELMSEFFGAFTLVNFSEENFVKEKKGISRIKHKLRFKEPKEIAVFNDLIKELSEVQETGYYDQAAKLHHVQILNNPELIHTVDLLLIALHILSNSESPIRNEWIEDVGEKIIPIMSNYTISYLLGDKTSRIRGEITAVLTTYCNDDELCNLKNACSSLVKTFFENRNFGKWFNYRLANVILNDFKEQFVSDQEHNDKHQALAFEYQKIEDQIDLNDAKVVGERDFNKCIEQTVISDSISLLINEYKLMNETNLMLSEDSDPELRQLFSFILDKFLLLDNFLVSYGSETDRKRMLYVEKLLMLKRMTILPLDSFLDVELCQTLDVFPVDDPEKEFAVKEVLADGIMLKNPNGKFSYVNGEFVTDFESENADKFSILRKALVNVFRFSV